MNLIKSSLATSLMLALLASPAHAITTQGNAIAHLIAPLTIYQSRELAFGDVYTDADNRDWLNDTQVNSSTKHDGSFAVSGEAGYAYSITMDSTVTLQNISGSSSLITADIWLVSTNTTYGSNTLGYDGNSSIEVRGRLRDVTGAGSGNYTGTYNITVSY